jgi:chemotaxis protein methyltransferase CheR
MANSTLQQPSVEFVEQTATPELFRIRDVVYQTCGIYHAEDKIYLLSAACKRRMALMGAKTVREYLDRLTFGDGRGEELRLLLNEITIGETCLFRSQPQMEALRKVILPQLVESKTKMGLRRLRLWSAGCSTGEEPYTLAILLHELRDTLLRGWTFEIVATDLNDSSVEKAKSGVYGDYALRNTPDQFKKKYFRPLDDKFQVIDDLKSSISFSRLNLVDDSRMVFMKGLDIIFCCNVLIYFDAASKRRVVQHFYANLLPNGYFFLGHSESLYQVNDQFRLVHFPGIAGYWKTPPDFDGGGR